MRSEENKVIKLVVDSLGQHGDGISFHQGKTYYVPRALPEEEVEVEVLQVTNSQVRTNILSVINSAPSRREAPCPYFSSCGGCSLQHMNLGTYREFKVHKVETELKRFNLKPDKWGSPIFLGEGLRRRVEWKARKRKKRIELGYYTERSHNLVDISNCLVAEDKISKLISPLKEILLKILKGGQEIGLSLTSTDNGLDLLIKFDEDIELTYGQREDLAQWARVNELARIQLKMPSFTDPIACLSDPLIKFDGISVSLSAGGFLQASKQADEVLTELVLSSVKECDGEIVDLFCGRGTFTLPLSKSHKVTGIEMDDGALDSLSSAARQSKRSVTTKRQQLFESPLKAEEMNSYSAIVLDPPRAGAKTQCEEISKSSTGTLVYVSCNPATFSRDAEVLVAGGYSLNKVTVIDQFIYSAHVELVAVFSK